MIAAPASLTLLRFELVRHMRSRSSLLALVTFIAAQALYRILTWKGVLNVRDGEFLLTYLATLIFILRFDLAEDRDAGFDEALAANGVTPIGYAAAKIGGTAGFTAGFTVACLIAAVTAGGVSPLVAITLATQAFLIAWLLSPLALFVETVSGMRMSTAAAYLLFLGALWGLLSAGRLLEVTHAIGLSGASARDLGRLLLTNLVVATPALLLIGWLGVARRLRTRS